MSSYLYWITVLGFVLLGQTLKAQKTETVEGRLFWNLYEFEGFYGVEDSVQKIITDTIEIFRENVSMENKEFERFFREYDLIKSNNLLDRRCQFIMTKKGEKIRIYFKKRDFKKIRKTDWVNKNKKEKVHTFLVVKAEKIFESTYFGKKIIKIEQRVIEEHEK